MIDAETGFADFDLRQMDGVVLALDRVAQEQRYVSGTGYDKQPS